MAIIDHTFRQTQPLFFAWEDQQSSFPHDLSMGRGQFLIYPKTVRKTNEHLSRAFLVLYQSIEDPYVFFIIKDRDGTFLEAAEIVMDTRFLIRDRDRAHLKPDKVRLDRGTARELEVLWNAAY